MAWFNLLITNRRTSRMGLGIAPPRGHSAKRSIIQPAPPPLARTPSSRGRCQAQRPARRCLRGTVDECVCYPRGRDARCTAGNTAAIAAATPKKTGANPSELAVAPNRAGTRTLDAPPSVARIPTASAPRPGGAAACRSDKCLLPSRPLKVVRLLALHGWGASPTTSPAR